MTLRTIMSANSVSSGNIYQTEANSCEVHAKPESNLLPLTSYKPRGSLARALYEKQLADNYLSTVDKNKVRVINLTNNKYLDVRYRLVKT